MSYSIDLHVKHIQYDSRELHSVTLLS